MIKPVSALIHMLQGKIILEDNTDVRIIKREYPIDKTPCLTIDDSGGTAILQKKIIDKDYLVDNEIIPQQVIREQRSITLNLNVWCDTEDERDEITEVIQDIFYKLQSDYYQYCTQYNDGECISLEDDCQVNPDTMRGVKCQCPRPKEYGYQNLFTKFDIIRSSFDVEPAFIQDDDTTTPITLRSIITISFMYYDYYNIGGKPINTLTFDEEVL
jgi:hypothetical protein